MRQRPESSVIMLMILLAVVLGVGGALAYSFLRNRPASPEGTAVVTVENIAVTVRRDEAQQMRIVPQPAAQPEVVEEPAEEESAEEESAEEEPAEEEQAGSEEENASEQENAEDERVEVNAAPAVAADSIIWITHRVGPNDTLYSLTRRYATSIALMARFGIAADHLITNQDIRIPVGNPDYCPNRRPYAVREGETAFSIARRFNTTAETLRDINNLDNNFTIYSGTVICVP